MTDSRLRPVNMKFTFDWCVFAYPNNNNRTEANAQCNDVCSGPDESAKSALEDRLLQTNATIQYQYCEDGNGAFGKIVDDCAKCLDNVPNAKTLSNCTTWRLKSKISAPMTDWFCRRQGVKRRLRSTAETW